MTVLAGPAEHFLEITSSYPYSNPSEVSTAGQQAWWSEHGLWSQTAQAESAAQLAK